jgi:hypothetical protein
MRIKEMKKGLQGWWAPRQVDELSPSPRSGPRRTETRARIHARLDCYLLHMFIGRPFILAHRQMRATRQCRHTDEVKEIALPASATSHGQWDFLIHDSITAAEEAINICHDLRTSCMGLAKSSYAEYSSCRASLLVLIAHSVCCRTNEHSSTLRKGLDAIREMASVGESAQSEVSLLETLEEALHRINAFNGEESTIAIEKDSSEAGYEGLLTWYTNMAGSTNMRPNASTLVSADSQDTRIPGPVFTQSRLNDNYVQNTNNSSHQITDEYPFDLDLLNADGNTAFFTPNVTEFGNVEHGLFENLLWPPG